MSKLVSQVQHEKNITISPVQESEGRVGKRSALHMNNGLMLTYLQRYFSSYKRDPAPQLLIFNWVTDSLQLVSSGC